MGTALACGPRQLREAPLLDAKNVKRPRGGAQPSTARTNTPQCVTKPYVPWRNVAVFGPPAGEPSDSAAVSAPLHRPHLAGTCTAGDAPGLNDQRSGSSPRGAVGLAGAVPQPSCGRQRQPQILDSRTSQTPILPVKKSHSRGPASVTLASAVGRCGAPPFVGILGAALGTPFAVDHLGP